MLVTRKLGGSVVEGKMRNFHNPLEHSGSRLLPRVIQFQLELGHLEGVFEWCLKINNSWRSMPFVRYASIDIMQLRGREAHVS